MTTLTHFDHLLDAVIVMNLRQEITYFNHQSSIFFKMPPRILKSKNHIIQLCDTNDFDLETWISKGVTSFDVMTSPEFKMYLPHEPNTEYHVIMKLIPLEGDANGAQFAVVFHDMTVEKTLHMKYREQVEELKKAHNQFLQADKLNTLGEVTANISHEINNPLTIAAGHAEILGDYLRSPSPISKIEAMKKANETVMESLERVNQIIKNMKDFLHQSQDEKEYCDLEALVDTAMEWIQPTAKKANIEVSKVVKAEKTAILANKIKLEQVVINLVKNSIDAIIDAGKEDGKIEIVLSKSKDDHQVMIDVKDNGPGIPANVKENLFKPFTSSKESGKGTGLGLSICLKIVESHQGKLELMPTDNGAHFRLRLPMIEIYSYSRNDKSLGGSPKEKRVLVLDNEVQILNVLNSFISEEGLVFIGSSQPEDALEFLSKAHVDLIVTDFSMPGMTGGEFARKAREKGYDGSLLYMTSAKFIEQYNKDKSDLQLDGIIVKPFNKSEVMNTINHALKKAS
jgi:signal transduction histidine kinase